MMASAAKGLKWKHWRERKEMWSFKINMNEERSNNLGCRKLIFRKTYHFKPDRGYVPGQSQASTISHPGWGHLLPRPSSPLPHHSLEVPMVENGWWWSWSNPHQPIPQLLLESHPWSARLFVAPAMCPNFPGSQNYLSGQVRWNGCGWLAIFATTGFGLEGPSTWPTSKSVSCVMCFVGCFF